MGTGLLWHGLLRAGRQRQKAVDALARLKALVPEITASNVEKTFPYALAEDRAYTRASAKRACQTDRQSAPPNFSF